MSTASQNWNRRPVRAGQRTYTGRPISAAAAAEWERLTNLIEKASPGARRAYLVDKRHRLLQRALLQQP